MFLFLGLSVIISLVLLFFYFKILPGFRKIGSGVLLSTVASIFINIGLSGKTRPVIHSFLLCSFYFESNSPKYIAQVDCHICLLGSYFFSINE